MAVHWQTCHRRQRIRAICECRPDAYNDPDVLYRSGVFPGELCGPVGQRADTAEGVNASTDAAGAHAASAMLIFRGRPPAAIQAVVALISNRGYLHRERDRLNYRHRLLPWPLTLARM